MLSILCAVKLKFYILPTFTSISHDADIKEKILSTNSINGLVYVISRSVFLMGWKKKF